MESSKAVFFGSCQSTTNSSSFCCDFMRALRKVITSCFIFGRRRGRQASCLGQGGAGLEKNARGNPEVWGGGVPGTQFLADQTCLDGNQVFSLSLLAWRDSSISRYAYREHTCGTARNRVPCDLYLAAVVTRPEGREKANRNYEQSTQWCCSRWCRCRCFCLIDCDASADGGRLLQQPQALW